MERPKRVLIVDDERAYTDSLKKSLEATGNYLVRAVNRHEEAVPAALEFRPDIAFLEVIICKSDFDLSARFKAHPHLSSIPVVHLAFVSPKMFPDLVTPDAPILYARASVQEFIKMIEKYTSNSPSDSQEGQSNSA